MESQTTILNYGKVILFTGHCDVGRSVVVVVDDDHHHHDGVATNVRIVTVAMA